MLDIQISRYLISENRKKKKKLNGGSKIDIVFEVYQFMTSKIEIVQNVYKTIIG